MDEYEYDPIKATIRDYLTDVQDVLVVSKVPKNRPAQFIQLITAGGTGGIVSQRVMVTFLCWDESEYAAAVLAERVRALMKECTRLGGLPVYRVRDVGLPVERPDPDTEIDRYQFTLEINVRGRLQSPSP